MSNDESTIDTLVNQIDGKGSDIEVDAIEHLRHKTGVDFPRVMLKTFQNSRAAKIRCACITYCVPYARHFHSAVELGIIGLSDKSKVVRAEACGLLAVSLNKTAMESLYNARKCEKHPEVTEHIDAAISSIEHQDHNLFVDRDASGNIVMRIEIVTHEDVI